VTTSAPIPLPERLARWFAEGQTQSTDPREAAAHATDWWKVMCLTGVDYFSTLAYQPSIAFLAAGALAPVATLVLILVTLFGALPMYRRVAELSPHGQGSIFMLEQLFPRWKGKLVVLCLLGFAATDFVITITLSAADASAHLVENPLAPPWLDHPMLVTLGLLLVLGAIFLRGFREAILLAVALVVTYLALNVVVILTGLRQVAAHPELVANWRTLLVAQHGNPLMMLAMALILFPKLALGLSGFETGVAVMPLVRGEPGEAEDEPVGRIRNTRKLLGTAALIMSVMLIGSTLVSVLLIRPELFERGGPADGRALAYLAHEYLGPAFGTVYDLSTISILWFAGASAMAGLLNLVPRYLPRYGMAPEWARATRPLVVIVTAITVLVTIIFDADVDAQGGAYATGVLVLMSSAALSVALSAWRGGRRGRLLFASISVVFLYTTIANIFERPEGIKIASTFIVTIVVTSLVSRALRSTELRVQGVKPDALAASFIAEAGQYETIRLIANRPGPGDVREYDDKLREARDSHHLPPDTPVLFLEVRPGDASEFSDVLHVHGGRVDGYRVLRCQSPAIPNAIAALLLWVRDETGRSPTPTSAGPRAIRSRIC
jgi:hypothetical protein